MKRTLLFVALVSAGSLFSSNHAEAAGFTYYGNLQDAGKPADGKYDIELTLYTAPTGGNVIGGPLTIYAVNVSDGTFSTEADFGPLAKSFGQSYVGVRVRAAGKGEFATLDTRSNAVTSTNTSCPGSWSLDGNAGNPAGSYLGTADNVAVVVKAAGTQAARFSPGTQSASIGSSFNSNGFASVSVSGSGSEATASYGFAGGLHGTVTNPGSFVWSDSTATSLITDSAANQFIAKASGGVGINTVNGPLGTEPLGGTELTIRPTSGIGHQSWINLLSQRTASTSNFRGVNLASDPIDSGDNLDDGSFVIRSIFKKSDGTVLYEPMVNAQSFNTVSSTIGNTHFMLNGAPVNILNTITVGTTTSNGNGASLTIGGVWTDASSRTFKEAFELVDPTTILAKVTSMPVTTWFYKGDHGEGRHMGPMAEDFAESFGLGADEKHIGTVDESGVAFAAIQGLNQKVETENAQLKTQNLALQGKLDEVLARLAKLETAKGN
jgi:hypothetical protein